MSVKEIYTCKSELYQINNAESAFMTVYSLNFAYL